MTMTINYIRAKLTNPTNKPTSRKKNKNDNINKNKVQDIK